MQIRNLYILLLLTNVVFLNNIFCKYKDFKTVEKMKAKIDSEQSCVDDYNKKLLNISNISNNIDSSITKLEKVFDKLNASQKMYKRSFLKYTKVLLTIKFSNKNLFSEHMSKASNIISKLEQIHVSQVNSDIHPLIVINEIRANFEKHSKIIHNTLQFKIDKSLNLCVLFKEKNSKYINEIYFKVNKTIKLFSNLERLVMKVTNEATKSISNLSTTFFENYKKDIINKIDNRVLALWNKFRTLEMYSKLMSKINKEKYTTLFEEKDTIFINYKDTTINLVNQIAKKNKLLTELQSFAKLTNISNHVNILKTEIKNLTSELYELREDGIRGWLDDLVSESKKVLMFKESFTNKCISLASKFIEQANKKYAKQKLIDLEKIYTDRITECKI